MESIRKERDGANKEVLSEDNNLQSIIYNMFIRSDFTMERKVKLEKQIDLLIQKYNQDSVIMGQESLETIESHFMDSSMPAEPVGIDEYLEILRDKILKNATHINNPKYIGHMTTALPCFVEAISSLIVAINQNVVKVETAKGLTPCERQVIAMIHKLLYKKDDMFYRQNMQRHDTSLGVITSGGTIANITALWCARNKLFGPKDEFTGIEKTGFLNALKYYGYEDAVVIGSETMHYSFYKGATLLGLGEENLIKIKCDSNGHISMEDLSKTVTLCRKRNIGIICIIGVAGTTSSGNIDPLTQIGELCQREHIYFHVDAAWGGALAFSRKHHDLLNGIQYADSITIDGHKQLYVPMGCGMVIFKDLDTAGKIQKNTAYILRRKSADLGQFSIEGSRPAVSLYLHSALHLIGAKGYECLVDYGIEMIQCARSIIQKMQGIELVGKQEINILNYRFIPDRLYAKWKAQELTEKEQVEVSQFNILIQKEQREKNQSFVSRTEVSYCSKGKTQAITVLRMVIANPLTTREDIKQVLDEQKMITVEINRKKNKGVNKEVRNAR